MARLKHKSFGHSKNGNIERRTFEAENKMHEPSFKRRMKMHSPRKWEQSAVKHPAWTREFLQRAYGSEAFNRNGTIKMTYLNMAIANAKHMGDTKLEKRLVLARTYKQQ